MVTRGIVHVSPDGTLVAVNRCGPDGCETQVVDLASGEVFRPQRAMTGFLRALTDETIILTGGQHGASDDRAWVLALGARDGGRRWHVADQGLRDPVAARHGSLVGVLGSRRSGFALARIDRTGHVRDLTPRRSAPIPWVWREVSSPDLVVTSMVGSFETALASPRPVAAAVIDVAGGVRLIDPMWIDLGVEPTGTDDRPASAYASVMDESLSTTELAWVLGRSSGSIRRMIRDGELESIRIPAGFRVPKTEALRVARERIEAEAGRKVSDRELEALIDQVIATNDAAG
jgi:excisionase family DNA binding protein